MRELSCLGKSLGVHLLGKDIIGASVVGQIAAPPIGEPDGHKSRNEKSAYNCQTKVVARQCSRVGLQNQIELDVHKCLGNGLLSIFPWRNDFFGWVGSPRGSTGLKNGHRLVLSQQ